MCGRYSLVQTKEKISSRFGVKFTENFKPRYNVAPTQEVPVITNTNPTEISFFKWGLIPNWALNELPASNLINARGETVLSKPPFKQIIRGRRCLILADGFYEWKKEGRNKVPHRITLCSDEIFSFAGLWDSWETPEGEIINSFSIITTEANSAMKEIHDRMPVILTRENEERWIQKLLSDKDIIDLLKPIAPEKISFYKVHKAVNSSQYDTPECIQIAPKFYPGETLSLFD